MGSIVKMFQWLRKTVFWEYLEAIFWAGCMAIILTTFVIQAFKIPSGSMLETLQIGDHLLVNKFLYGLKNPFSDSYLIKGIDPKVGDVIVFRYPKDTSVDYIKRIVGVPGDILEMKDKILYRNGEKVVEPYVQHSQEDIIVPVRDNWGPIVVPSESYFVLGDNRDDSLDSRFWGFVNQKNICGKAWIIYWSSQGLHNIRFDRIGKFIHEEN